MFEKLASGKISSSGLQGLVDNLHSALYSSTVISVIRELVVTSRV
jgi:hypothetical protein